MLINRIIPILAFLLCLGMWSVTVLGQGAAVCGNALLEGGEQCDDGNVTSGDGCSTTCQVEPGYRCSEPVPPDLANIIADPGFEAGPGGGYWTEDAVYNLPICTPENCLDVSGQRSGSYWAWFGGVSAYDTYPGSGGIISEEALLLQQVAIPNTASEMRFWVRAAACDSGSDYLELLIGNDQAWAINGDDASCGETTYTQYSVDISPWADNVSHDIQFHAETFGVNEDWSNFFLDDIELMVGSVDPVPSQCEQLAGPLAMVKAAAPSTYSQVGDVIDYNYTLTNNTGITLYPPYTVDDDKASDESCPATPISLAPGASFVCTASYTIIQADIDASSVTNIATGSAFDAASDGLLVVSNSDSATVTYDASPQEQVIFRDGFETSL